MPLPRVPKDGPKDDTSLAAYFGMDLWPAEGAAIGGSEQVFRTADYIVQQSRLPRLLEEWESEDRQGRARPGPKPWISPVQIVVLLVVLALSRRPVSSLEMAHLLDSTPAEVLASIGIEEREEPATLSGYYHRGYRPYRLLRSLIDPEPESLRERHLRTVLLERARKRDHAQAAKKRARAYEFAAEVLRGTWMLLPREVRRQWHGDVALDATFLKAPAYAPRNTSLYASSDPGCGWYVREGDHDGDQAARDGRADVRWGREAHTLLAVSRTNAVPQLTLSITLDRPGKRIAKNALTVVDIVAKVYADIGHEGPAPVGHFSADRAYLPNSKAERLPLPLRARGYKLVMDYDRTDIDLGVTASHAGAELVDGQWSCPGMPQGLKDASIERYVTKTIPEDTYRERLERRRAFSLHDKAQADEDGYVRKQCPAVGPHATVSCPLRQMHPKTDGKRLVRITKQQTPREPLQVCEQKSVTIPPTAGAKHRQEYAYKSEEWRAWYSPPRQSVESNNKSLKDGAHNPLDDSERRLARGWAALLLVATALTAAANVRKTISWLKEKVAVTYLGERNVGPRRRDRLRNYSIVEDPALANAPPDEARSA